MGIEIWPFFCQNARFMVVGRFPSKKRVTALDAQESAEFHYVARFLIKSQKTSILSICDQFLSQTDRNPDKTWKYM